MEAENWEGETDEKRQGRREARNLAMKSKLGERDSDYDTTDRTSFQFGSFQSIDRFGGGGGGGWVWVGGMRNDSAEILFQSFLQEPIVSSSGMGRDVHFLTLSIKYFLCRTKSLSRTGATVSASREQTGTHAVSAPVEDRVICAAETNTWKDQAMQRKTRQNGEKQAKTPEDKTAQRKSRQNEKQDKTPEDKITQD